MKKRILDLMVIILLLVSCAQGNAVEPTKEEIAEAEIIQILTDTLVPVSDTPEPTTTATEIPPSNTPKPTETLEPPTLTPLPAGVLFRDDFNGVLQPGWTWINENPERWSFVEEGWLEIVGDNPSFFMEDDFGMINFLTRDIPEDEFMITAHIQSNPNENFQQAAIFIYENQNNYIALNIGYCQPCKVGGPGFFMETFIDNNPFENAYMVNRSPNDTDIYLRLVNQGGSVTGYYATIPGEWQRIGAFGNYFDFKYLGLGTTNSNLNGVETDIVSRFDFFEISQP